MYNYRAIGCLVLYQAPCCSCCCRAVPELFSASAASAAANELQSALGERGISPLRVAARVCAALSTAEVPSSGLEDEFRKNTQAPFRAQELEEHSQVPLIYFFEVIEVERTQVSH